MRIAVIAGDGIGREVVGAGCQVLSALFNTSGSDAELSLTEFDWGSERYLSTGQMMPADGLATLKDFDAILFGSAGDPRVPDHISLWQLRLAICQGLDQYANVRPARLLPGISSPLRDVRRDELDWVIIRENSEGEYSGAGGRVHKGLDHEVGIDLSIMTRIGVERIIRYGFETARSRPRKSLILVTKSNAQRHAMVMWDEIFGHIAAEYPDIESEKMLVDAMTTRMVLKPGSIDTVVASNLHADILSDLAAALTGSLGIAPTGNIRPDRIYPSMFEPIHGSAFDIAGKGIANPLGTIWSIAMMLEHLGRRDLAARVMKAIEAATAAQQCRTPDLGGKATTADVAEAIISALHRGGGE